MTVIKRQFIAGASCPECGQLDKIQRVESGTSVWMECVRCGMTRPLDTPSAEGTPVTIQPAGKPETRH